MRILLYVCIGTLVTYLVIPDPTQYHPLYSLFLICGITVFGVALMSQAASEFIRILILSVSVGIIINIGVSVLMKLIVNLTTTIESIK